MNPSIKGAPPPGHCWCLWLNISRRGRPWCLWFDIWRAPLVPMIHYMQGAPQWCRKCGCKRAQKSPFWHELNKKKKEGGKKEGFFFFSFLIFFRGGAPFVGGAMHHLRTRPCNDYGLYGDAWFPRIDFYKYTSGGFINLLFATMMRRPTIIRRPYFVSDQNRFCLHFWIHQYPKGKLLFF